MDSGVELCGARVIAKLRPLKYPVDKSCGRRQELHGLKDSNGRESVSKTQLSNRFRALVAAHEPSSISVVDMSTRCD